jgi:fructose transport system permease protein
MIYRSKAGVSLATPRPLPAASAPSGGASLEEVGAPGPVEMPGPVAGRWQDSAWSLAGHRVTGPLTALVVAVVVFWATTSTFMTASNISLVLQQSTVVGVLALGQTLVILTAGIDLANSAIAVMGTVVMGKLLMQGSGGPVVALMGGFVLCALLGAVSGGIVSKAKLPPFIVTLGMLGIVTAAAQLYTGSQSFSINPGLLTWLSGQLSIGSFSISYGVVVALGAYLVIGYMLTQTAWGVHVLAVGNNAEAARRSGIKVGRVLLSVYVTGGLLYGLAAWEALGRVAVADPSSYSTANLASITAVVIGGTSLFGGRGGALGTLVGTLIVNVLSNGLYQANIDSLYQDVATGALVIVAVAVDQFVRRRAVR